MQEKLLKILPLVQKPIRYTGGEYNLFFLKPDEKTIKCCLVFPEVYEIGMSNYGLKILYSKLNFTKGVICERAYAPWFDFGQQLKKNEIPLYSLETKTFLKDFHIIGFSLQSELSYPNVLYCLDLSKIPLKAQDRKISDPLVIAGGPCATNPLPMAEFFDAFVIGDGEEVILEIVETYRSWNRRNRDDLLRSLSQLEGVYVPLFHSDQSEIKRRFVKELRDEDFPFPPLVPICEIVHDHLTIEISRGCGRRCRFCQAGFITQPLRMRSIEQIYNLCESAIRSTGWEEVSLLAFSAGDYPDLAKLLEVLNQILKKRMVALSLPSLRGEDFNYEIIRQLKAIKKTGITFAPETVSSRLKRIINKEIPEEQIISAAKLLTQANWPGVKFYFMIGLPTETEEDVKEIAHFVNFLAKELKPKQLRVAISPFIPKPHTPFQYAAFEDSASLKHKIDLLFRAVRHRNVKFKYERIEAAQIQAVLARGDRRLSSVIEDVYKKGGIFQDWSDYFRPEIWQESFMKFGIEPKSFLVKRDLNQSLPWDFIIASHKEVLKKEYEKALENGKRVKANSPLFVFRSAENLFPGHFFDSEPKSPFFYRRRYRIKYSVGESFRFASHLDIVRAVYRTLRRSELPVAYSQGFTPHLLVSFGPPRPVGIISKAEYLDLELNGYYNGNLLTDLASFLSKDLVVLEAKEIKTTTPSLSKSINLLLYHIEIPDNLRISNEFLNQKREIFGLHSYHFAQGRLEVFVHFAPKVKLFEIIMKLLNLSPDTARLLNITRVEQFIIKENKLLTPMEVV